MLFRPFLAMGVHLRPPLALPNDTLTPDVKIPPENG